MLDDDEMTCVGREVAWVKCAFLMMIRGFRDHDDEHTNAWLAPLDSAKLLL